MCCEFFIVMSMEMHLIKRLALLTIVFHFRKRHGKEVFLLWETSYLQFPLHKIRRIKRLAIKIMYFSYWIFNWFAISYHLVLLTSHSVVRQKELAIKQATDLFNPSKPEFLDWRAGVPYDRGYLSSAAKSGSPEIQRLVANLDTFDTPEECVHQTLKQRQYTCITHRSKLQLLIKALPAEFQKNLYISPLKSDPAVAVFVVPKHFPFLKTMDSYIAILFEAGILTHWEDELDVQASRLQAKESGKMRMPPKTQDSGINLLPRDFIKRLLVMYGAAISMFLSELIWFHSGKIRKTLGSFICSCTVPTGIAWGQKFRNTLGNLYRPSTTGVLVKVRPSSLT